MSAIQLALASTRYYRSLILLFASAILLGLLTFVLLPKKWIPSIFSHDQETVDIPSTSLSAQTLSLQKVILSEDGSSIFTQKSAENEVSFSKISQGRDTQRVATINRNNLTLTDIMWDVYKNKLLFIKFYWFINDFRCGIISAPVEDTIQPLIIDETINFREFLFYNPYPLSINFGQALYASNKNAQSYYQPYDFIIDDSGIYFIIGNTYTGKYELWHYPGKYFTQKDIISNHEKSDIYYNSREKWKKYILSDIMEPVDQSKIILVKDGANLVMFSAKGNIYQLQKRGSKIKSIPLGSIDEQYRHLLIISNKKDQKVSYLKQDDAILLKDTPVHKVPFLTLNEIVKK
ncbi:MAG: hypothetical protein NW218_16670 [Saprospiraceae bacterium]|nr:hypothetical protein [Saprospiraceae bacterium]